MLATGEKLKYTTKPYLSATTSFAAGADTPRDFLERCLADLEKHEPQIGAFVHLNLNAARVAADQSAKRWRDGKPLSKIDGMPVGIKDIIETIDMPTEKARRCSPASAPNVTPRASRRCARPAPSSSARP